MKFSVDNSNQSRHLNKSQLLPHDTSCPLCGSKNRKPVCTLQESPQISLLKCTNCNAASASRIPTNEALVAYYQDYYVTPLSPDCDARVTCGDTQRFGLHLAARLNKYLNTSSMSILDFGGGDGSVALKTAEQLLKRGFEKVEITVVDYNKTLVSTGDKRISLEHQETLEDLQPLNYNFIIASAIIEHVPQPKEILIRLLNLLQKGGIFYARTPYAVPFIRLSKFLGIKWDFAFPAHIHDFGQDFWEPFFCSTLSSNDFSVLVSRPSIVARAFKHHPLRALAAYAFKSPWYLFRRQYPLVGGWEVFVRKNSDETMLIC